MAERAEVTVVGEGLVGSVLTLQLARRGMKVRVFERRGDPRRGRQAAGRSINLAISTRGLHALRQVGLEAEALSRAVPMRGRMVHPLGRTPNLQPYDKAGSRCINSISRAWLNRLLIEHAARTGRARISFGAAVVGADLRAGALRVKDGRTGRLSTHKAGVIFAADGAASAVRRELSQLPRFDLSQTHLEHGYKELSIPAGPDGSFQLEKNALHIWPRKSHMLIALPNFEGSFTATLFLPFDGPVSFAALPDAASVRAFFAAQFPDAASLIPDLAEQFLANPTGAMVTVKCRPWSYGGRALLLGDAAHAIVPFFGQGMNCGFEDCAVLGECLDEGGALEEVFQRFTALRKPNCDAIADMAVENFIEMRDKVADPGFLLEKGVEKVLQERFPERYIPRYALVTFSRVPYETARRAGLAQTAILSALCAGLEDPSRVDLAKADTLIARHLEPVLKGAPL